MGSNSFFEWFVWSLPYGAIVFITYIAVSYARDKAELKKKNERLKCRIIDLEARICPDDKHDWKYMYTVEEGGITDCPMKSRYKCSRCGKIKNVVRWGP